MADSKITALASIGTGTDPANDPLVIVDVSDILPGGMSLTGTTKKVTLNNLLACSPTATLASATITGDLTVRTNRLATTTIGVGIGTASPIVPLDVRGGAGAGALFLRTTDPTAAVSSAYIQTPVSTGFSALVPIYGFWYQNCGLGNPASDAVTLITASTERYRIDSAGTNTWSNVGGVAGTAMTLNANGLGIGVTPSAFGANQKALQVGSFASIYNDAFNGAAVVGFNVYQSANSTYNYIATGITATRYEQRSASHFWYSAGSGTAGNPISFGDAKMTLDASGNLILLSSNTPATLATNGQLTVNATSNTNLRFSYRGSDGVTRTANITLA